MSIVWLIVWLVQGMPALWEPEPWWGVAMIVALVVDGIIIAATTGVNLFDDLYW